MKESDLISQFSRDLTEYRQANKLSLHYWHKLADVPLASIAASVRQCLCPACTVKVGQRTGLFRAQGGRAVRNPFDVLCLIDGIPIALEFKLHKDHTAVPLDMVMDHQVEALRDFHNAYGIGLLMFGVDCERDKITWPVPPEWEYRGRLEFIAMVTIKEWYWLAREMKRLGRKSIPLDYFWRQEISLCGRTTGMRGRRWWNIPAFQEAIHKFANLEFQEVSA